MMLGKRDGRAKGPPETLCIFQLVNGRAERPDAHDA